MNAAPNFLEVDPRFNAKNPYWHYRVKAVGYPAFWASRMIVLKASILFTVCDRHGDGGTKVIHKFLGTFNDFEKVELAEEDRTYGNLKVIKSRKI